jgi:hypothetical protein
LLLAAHPHRAGLLTPTLLVDVTVPFLGQSPAVKSVYPADNASSHLANMPPMTTRAGHPGRAAKGTAREMLKLFEGEWVHVVGWLEGDASRYNREARRLPPDHAWVLLISGE